MENVAENEETYLNSSQKRLPRITSGGSGIYCCVTRCAGASCDIHKQKSGIGFFKFPENVLVSIEGEGRRYFRNQENNKYL